MSENESKADRILSAAREAIENAGGIDALAADILSLADDAVGMGDDCVDAHADPDTACIDVRLQIVCVAGSMQADPSEDPDDWSVRLWSGSSDCDTDHRGYWGTGTASAVRESGDDDDDDSDRPFAPMSAAEACSVAESMMAEALDHLAQCID